jgi:predicted acetylornithine/succinylornithine family transaminase
MTSAIDMTNQYIAQTYRRAPFVISHGKGVRVWDENGNEYLDMMAGIAVMSLGHSDPQVAAIIRDQAEKLVHISNLFYTAPQARLAKALVENSFADRVFFSNSGTEANEGAIKFARKVAHHNGEHDRCEIIAFEHAFHGRTMGSLALTPKPAYQDPFRPLMGEATILPVNDLEAATKHISRKTAAVFIEPVQGEGGVRPVEAEFLRGLRKLCDDNGALLVFDEVQCGLGRTGYLWAHEHYGVMPDMMTLAKPLAAGLPIGAILLTEAINSALVAGDHGSTFAGGALTCTVAEHVLSRVSDPAFLAHVNETGAYLVERLREINSPHIKEIRGRGLMIGVEMDIPVADLVQEGYRNGLLLVNAGPDTLRLLPPLVITKPDIDLFTDRLTTMLMKM